MGRIRFSERLAATKFALKSHFRPSDEIRISPLPMWPVPDVTAEKLRGSAEFMGDPNADSPRRVGLVAVNRELIIQARQESQGGRLGVARTLGNVVLFGVLPAHAMVGILKPVDDDDLRFGVRIIGAETMRVAPALQLPDRSLHILLSGIAKASTEPMDEVPRRVRIY